MTVQIVLPFPPSGLTPHAKGNWRAKHGLTKRYRKLYAEEAIAQGLRGMAAEKIRAKVTLHMPNRRRDYTNCVHCTKVLIDALADVVGVNDRNWKVDFHEGELARPEGRVVVELEAA